MRSIARASVLSAFVAALAACGGGGDDPAPTPSPAPAPVPVPAPPPAAAVVEVSASQGAANGLVGETNASVARVLQADAARGLPGAALITALPTGATVEGTLQCSTFGTNGSGTITYTYTYTDAGQPVSYLFNYNNCTWSYSGTTIVYNGTATWEWTRWASATDYSVTYAYNISYAYSGAYSSSGTISTSATCVYATTLSCTYNVDGTRVGSDISVSTSGTVTTVRRASVTVDGTTTSGQITIVYDNWVYDSATGRATSGTVTATDSRGNSAVITATGSGYAVRVTYNGTQYDYTVTF